VPPYKLKIFKEVFLEKYKSKKTPDKSSDGSKEERIIGLTTKELCDYHKEEEINKLSISDRMDNILHHPRLLLPKECTNIPDKWLELEIFDLLKYPSKLDKFELYNEQNERTCICKFVKNYEKNSKLNGYFLKPLFCNYYSKIFGTMIYSRILHEEQCTNTKWTV
jgi:hypothetical protein